MILVIGGTGTIGSKVVEQLLAMQLPVRILSAGLSDWSSNITPMFRRSGVEMITADIRDQRALANAVQGCNGIVHAAGIVTGSPGNTIESVNCESVASLLPIAEQAGIQRFVYVSCLGATQFSQSAYLQSKFNAESLVRNSRFYWTIFRPAPVFGDGCQLVRTLESWIRRWPVVLVVGSGLNKLSPVAAEDVAACVAQSLYNKDTVGQTYDLSGPEQLSLMDVLELISDVSLDKRKPFIKIPAGLGYQLAGLMHRLNPRSPISSEFMKFVTADAIADHALMRSRFQVQGLPLESQFKHFRRVAQ